MFIFNCEVHMDQPSDDIDYFPPKQQYTRCYYGYIHLQPRVYYGAWEYEAKKDLEREIAHHKLVKDADLMIKCMDEAGVDMCCVVPHAMPELSYGARVRTTNGWLVKQVSKYPERLVAVATFDPILQRGVKNAIWELEYLVKEANVRAVKFYPPDTNPVDSPEMWPFYEKLQDLGVPIFIHMGANYLLGRTANCLPWLLEPVCEDFPELTILAYHMGYPFTDIMNVLAAKYPNLYIGTSMLPIWGGGISKRSQILVAEALMWAGPDKVIWGTDRFSSPGFFEREVAVLEKLQISEDLQRDYGYPPITDEVRAKWAGLNLARILKVEPKKFAPK